jgi:hypothetical protein
MLAGTGKPVSAFFSQPLAKEALGVKSAKNVRKNILKKELY